MNNEEKAMAYDNYVRESDELQRENSKIKSEFFGNVPPEEQLKIDRNNNRINILVQKLNDLFR